VAILKSLVSALSVARGASDERERPIVHLGATFGSASGLATRSRQSRASFCPAFRSVLACLATGIDWFEDRFDAIAGDYDTATSGDAAGRTKKGRERCCALSAGATASRIGEKMLGH
jgi:hypothetical protein